MSSHLTEPDETGPIYTTGTIGDPPVSLQESAILGYTYDDTFSYVPRLRTVQTRTFRTDGLPGDDGNQYQRSQITLIE